MKMRRALIVVLVMVAALFAAKLYAKDAVAAKTVVPDWHYRWHEGRWWYWMPDSRWMVWTGATWVPYEKFSSCPNTNYASQAKPKSSSYVNYETATESGSAQPVSSGTFNSQPTYSVGPSSDFAGYGWSWGPGTAYRNGPGRRF
jgi:hypothetical protein